ncbi:MAG: glycosyltransferase [Ilumatobacteraceae bacterium]
MSDRVPTFRVIASARSSGGGHAVAGNIATAARLHPDLLGDDPRSDAAFVTLNWVDPRRVGDRPFALMPQNAWPWSGEVSGVQPRARRWALRAASELSMRRATGVIRISDVIPARRRAVGDVLPNVLDEGFEQALADAEHARPLLEEGPYFASIGSLTTYRGISHLVRGYAAYRDAGGRIPLVIAGPGSVPLRDARRAADITAGVTFVEQHVPRPTVLATFRNATAAVFPSTVEVNAPLTALEAIATCRAVLVSDIPGHRALASGPRYYGTTDADELGRQLLDIDQAQRAAALPSPTDADEVERRAEVRRAWCDGLAQRLRAVAARMSAA